MSQIRRILLAIKDPDPRRDSGIAKAAGLAKACGASLELFHAVSTPLWLPSRPGECTIDDLKRETLEFYRAHLEKLATAARRRGVEVSCEAAWDSPPHEAVIRRAEEIGADLIVAPCHRGGRGRSWLMYLTDYELLRASRVPVLLFKGSEPYRHPVIVAAVDPVHAHDKPADLDRAILEDARTLSDALRGRLHAVHVNDHRLPGLALGDFFGSPYAAVATAAEYEKAERKSFDEFMEHSKIPAARCHLVPGTADARIPQLARELGAGIVVMGAVSRSGLDRLLIGNTAERVLAKLPCDVLVVKPHAFRTRVAKHRRAGIVLTPAPTSVATG